MILKPDELSVKDNHKLLIGSILPRPIAWVSSMDARGVLNLAPYSFFTVGSRNPMTLIFCPLVPGLAGSKKDTLLNIEQLPEFVVNLTNEQTAQAMNLTATELPHGESEFEWAGVTPAASETIRVPRVAEAPVAFECILQRIVTISEEPGGGSAVFGEVRCIHIRDDIYVGGYVSLEALQPIGRLAGASYTRVSDTFEMERLPRTLQLSNRSRLRTTLAIWLKSITTKPRPFSGFAQEGIEYNPDKDPRCKTTFTR